MDTEVNNHDDSKDFNWAHYSSSSENEANDVESHTKKMVVSRSPCLTLPTSYNFRHLANFYDTLLGATVQKDEISCLIETYAELVTAISANSDNYFNADMDDKAYFAKAVSDAYKFRHDLVLAIFLSSIMDEIEFGSDYDLSQIIDTKKTPDFCLFTEDHIYLIECNVSTDVAKSVGLKGEFKQDCVYTDEIYQLEEKLNKEVIWMPVHLLSNTYEHNLLDMLKRINDEDYNKDSDLIIRYIEELKNKVPNMKIIDSLQYLSNSYSTKKFSSSITKKAETFIKELVGYKTSRARLNKELSVNEHCWRMCRENKDQIIYDLNVTDFRNIKLVFTRRSYRLESLNNGFSNSKWLEWLNENNWRNIFKNSIYDEGYRRISCIGTGSTYTVRQPSQLSQSEVRSNKHPHRLVVDKCNDALDYFGRDNYCFDGEEGTMKNDDLEVDEIKNVEELMYNKTDMLHKHKLDENSVNRSIELLINKQKVYDQDIEMIEPKNPFTLPFVEPESLIRSDKETHDNDLLKSIGQVDSLLNLLTNKIINKKFKQKVLLPDEILDNYRDRKIEYINYIKETLTSGQVTADFNTQLNKNKFIPVNKARLTNDDKLIDLAEKVKSASKLIGEKSRELKSTQNENVIKVLSRNKLSDLLKKDTIYNWKVKEQKSVLRGIDSTYDKDSMSFCLKCLLHLRGETQFIVDNDILEHDLDTPQMMKLKEVMMSKHQEGVKSFQKLKLSPMSFFVQNFIYTLLYMSQKKMNSEEFSFSNLGYKNVLLLVRGGKKVWDLNTSRHYRLCYPVPEFFKKYKHLFSNSSTFIMNNNQLYLLTGWSVIDEKVLTDMCFCYYKTISTYCNAFVRKTIPDKVRDCDMFPFLLMLNNRRKTEADLSSLRNYIANCMGQYASLEQLSPEFASIKQDAIQRFILNRITGNISKFADSIRETTLKNYTNQNRSCFIFTDDELDSNQDLASMLYITYIQTKAPYNQALEQVKNMKKVLESHEIYMESINSNKNSDVYTRSNKTGIDVFDNEFYVDYNYAFRLGKNAATFYFSHDFVHDIHSKWDSLMDEPWSLIDTSSGMRGNYQTFDKGYYGRKGHEVVNEELMKDNIIQNVYGTLNDIIDQDGSSQRKVKKVNALNKGFLEKINEVPEKNFSFHIVDKVQWKGSREIYVMDMYTKLHLYPLEKFFGYLCKLVPNEIISIPASKRLTTIHSTLFEGQLPRGYVKYKLTLDCRRWGPMSMFLKYAYFVLGMAEVLPKTMVELFLYVTIKYFSKEIILSPKAYQIIKNNKTFKPYLQYLKEDNDLKSARMEMPYSFVMGIFNYLSSLLHAFNQMDATQFACETIYRLHRKQVIFKMNAHSDDSGGMLLVPKKDSDKYLKLALCAYEYKLRKVNHMFSIKKCVVSDVYFEILSILYINNQLLPLVPKFYGNISFKPSLKGYAVDISSSYSKCIELISMGATLSEAYFNMRVYSEQVRNFYHIPLYNDRPVSAYGGVFAHPLLVLLIGAAADNSRLYRINPDKFLNFQSAVKFLNGNKFETFQQSGFTPEFSIKMRQGCKVVNDKINTVYSEDILNHEMLANCQVKNTALYPINFHNQLKKTDFLASLSYYSNTRRLTRLMHTASATVNKTVIGNHSNKMLINIIDAMVEVKAECYNNIVSDVIKNFISKYCMIKDDLKQQNAHVEILGEANKIYDYLAEFKQEDVILEKESITCKPCSMHLNMDSSAMQLPDRPEVIFYSDDPHYYLLGKSKDYQSVKKMIQNKLNRNGLPCTDFDDFVYYTRCLEKTKKHVYTYSYVDSDNRLIQDYKGLANMIETNSCYGYKITKIHKYFRKQQRHRSLKHLPIKLQEDLNLLKMYGYIKNKTSEYFRIKSNGNYLEPKQYFKDTQNDMINDMIPYIVKKKLNKFNHDQVKEFFCSSPLLITWLRKQKRIGNNWVGSTELLFIIKGMSLRLLIERNSLTQLFISENLNLSDTQWDLILNLLSVWDIKINQKFPSWTNRLCLSFNSGRLSIKKEKNSEMSVCECHFDTSFNVNRLFNSKLSYYNDRLMCNKLPNKITDLTDIMDISINFILNNSDLTKDFIKQHIPIIYKNFITEDKIDLDDVIDNYPKCHLSKLSNEVSSRCNRGVPMDMQSMLTSLDSEYKPINAEMVLKMKELNLDPDSIPEDVKREIANIDFQNIKIENLSELLEDLNNGYDDEYSHFLNKWGSKYLQDSLVMADEYLLDVAHKDPKQFCEVYRDQIEIPKCKIIRWFMDMESKKLIDLSDRNLGFLRSPFGDYGRHLKNLFYKMKLDFLGSEKNNMVELQIRSLFKMLFHNSRSYQSFSKMRVKDNILKSIPLGVDLYEKWSNLFCCMLACDKNFSGSDCFDMNSLYMFEKKARGVDSNLVSYSEKDVVNSYYKNYEFSCGYFNNKSLYRKVNFFDAHYELSEYNFPMQFESKPFKGHEFFITYRNYHENLDEQEIDIDDNYEEFSCDSKYAECQEDYEECLEYLPEYKNFVDYHPFKTISKEYKVCGNELKYAYNKKIYQFNNIVKQEIDIPIYHCTGLFNLNNLINQSPRFICYCSKLPIDINNFEGELLKFCEPYDIRLKGSTVMLVFNMFDFDNLPFRLVSEEFIKMLKEYSSRHFIHTKNGVITPENGNYSNYNNVMKSRLEFIKKKETKSNLQKSFEEIIDYNGMRLRYGILPGMPDCIKLPNFDLSEISNEDLKEFKDYIEYHENFINLLNDKIYVLFEAEVLDEIPDEIKEIYNYYGYDIDFDYFLKKHDISNLSKQILSESVSKKVKKSLGQAMASAITTFIAAKNKPKLVLADYKDNSMESNAFFYKNRLDEEYDVYSPLNVNKMQFKEMECLFGSDVKYLLNKGLRVNKLDKYELTIKLRGLLSTVKMNSSRLKSDNKFKYIGSLLQLLNNMLKAASVSESTDIRSLKVFQTAVSRLTNKSLLLEEVMKEELENDLQDLLDLEEQTWDIWDFLEYRGYF